MTYAITGATGGIGRALIDEILARGERAVALVNPDSRRAADLPRDARLTVIPCALSDYETLAFAPHADVFLHLAWAKTTGAGRDDGEAQLQNARYTLDAVRLAARMGCTAFVGAGSQAEYGRQTAPLTPETPVAPESGYGIAKYAAGKLSRLLAQQLGLRHCWVRILSVYGEHDAPTTLIRSLIDALRAGERPALTPCEQTWDYLYVTDAARALLAVAERGHDGAVYPLGGGQGRPLADFVRDVRDVVAPGAPLGFGEKPYYPHQPMFLTADLTALRADTGFAPQVPFRQGVARILSEIKREEERCKTNANT